MHTQRWLSVDEPLQANQGQAGDRQQVVGRDIVRHATAARLTISIRELEMETAVNPAPSIGDPVVAPLTGNVFQVKVSEGQQVAAGDIVVIMEAMKMETEVRAPHAGAVSGIAIKEGDSVQVGDTLFLLG